MPKAGDVTFNIEPIAVLEAVGWLLAYKPYSDHGSSLVLSTMSPDDIEAAQKEWDAKVVESTIPLLDWVRRRKRILRYLEPMPLCLDRALVEWLAKYAQPAGGGLLARNLRNPPVSKAPKTEAAMHFFGACRMATTRRVGRPRLSRDEIVARVAIVGALPESSAQRILKRDAVPDIQSLLAALASKTP